MRFGHPKGPPPRTAPCRSRFRPTPRHSARPHDRGDGGCGAHPAGLSVRREPDPAGQPRPAARRHRLPRARELSARPGRDGRRAHRRARSCTRSTCPTARCWRPAASTSCRCWRASRCRREIVGGRQSEKLDRAARRVHPRHRRRHAPLRHDRGGLSRSALCRDQPADVSGAGARGLAAVADPLPHAAMRILDADALAALHARERLVDVDDADLANGVRAVASISPARPRTASSAIAPSATPA